MSLFLALFGHGAMSDLSPLSGVKRKLDFGAVRAAFDLGCVKTCAHEKCAELFSLLSCPDNRRQRFWYNVATTCHVLQHAKSPLRVALAVGQREHRELATQRCVIL